MKTTADYTDVNGCRGKTAIARANEMFNERIKDRSLLGDVLLYMKHGAYVVIYPDLFAIGRPVDSMASHEEIVDPETKFAHLDCWYVCMVCGELKRLLALLPYELPWMCFERKFHRGLKFYRTAQLLKITQSLTHSLAH